MMEHRDSKHIIRFRLANNNFALFLLFEKMTEFACFQIPQAMLNHNLQIYLPWFKAQYGARSLIFHYCFPHSRYRSNVEMLEKLNN